MKKKTILITTPIYYPSAQPHIGAATTNILADFLKRLYQLKGYDVLLTTGTDEHGDKIGRLAKQNGITPQQFVDDRSILFKNMADLVQMDYDDFIRTTEHRHELVVRDLWNKLTPYIYKGKYFGYYCSSEEAFYDKMDLNEINGKFYTSNNKEVEYLSIDCHFLKISILRDWLMDLFNNHSVTYPENRVEELKSFIGKELKDLCISRNDNVFGIRIDEKVVYVWLDALSNYLTVSKYTDGKDKYWSEVIHVVGKDIVTFHGVFWPAILKLGNLMPQNFKLFVHNWWLSKKEKMSKSIGNVVNPIDIVNKYGVDCLRFYCIFTNLINEDADFDEDNMINLFNSHMVNKFSNLIHRIYSILSKKGKSFDDCQIMHNEFYENQIHHIYFDINKFIKILFEWCDYLNAKIEKEQSWNNMDSAMIIGSEIKSIIKYFALICPNITTSFNNKIFPIFKRIEKIN